MKVDNRDGVLEIDLAAGKTLAELADVVEKCSIDKDSSIRVILLYATGRGFNAGGDVKEIESEEGHIGIMKQCSESLRVCSAMAKSRVPVIVAVQGYCIGLGIEIVGSADISIADKAAKFTFREIDNGTVGGAAQALRILPPPVVRYLMLTGGSISGEELYRMGGLSKVIDGNPLEPARKVARVIAEKSPRLVRDVKASIDGIERFSPSWAMRYEQGFIYPINIEGIGTAYRQRTLKRSSKL